MGHRVRAASRFKEKPTFGQQERLVPGDLWNTLILASTVELMWSLGQRCFPGMMSRLESFSASIGERDEGENLDALYRELSRHDFSSDLLETMPQKIAVMELSGVLWSDWGRADRVMESLAAIGRLPASPISCAATA